MSQLKVYNSLTRELEEFKPIEPGKVKIYVCGPTVYDHSHLGHARCYIIWDVVTRYLKFRGYELQYVRNITDVDDKIINRAKESNVKPAEIAEKFIGEFKKDMETINVAHPDIEPKATEYVNEMINLAVELLEKGNAYLTSGGVYFSVDSFNGYGKLSHQNLEDLRSGARVATDEEKKNPLDFALWKLVDESEEVYWESPWGKGRPGWHTECCVMIHKLMGKTIDIHAGGLDLAFPHHENERAQSEALTGQTFVNYWMHNGFVNVESEKMSKSLDNFKTIKELAESYDSNTIRLFILTNHYRMPVDFRHDALSSAKKGIKKIKNALKDARAIIDENAIKYEKAEKVADSLFTKLLSIEKLDQIKDDFPELASDFCSDSMCTRFPWARNEFSSLAWCIKEFIVSMDNDFNTSKALAILFDLASMIQKNRSSFIHSRSIDTDILNLMTLEAVILEKLTGVLGFKFDYDEKLVDDSLADDLMKIIIDIRKDARNDKNWALSDKIRDKLKEINIMVKDNKDGTTTWEVEK